MTPDNAKRAYVVYIIAENEQRARLPALFVALYGFVTYL